MSKIILIAMILLINLDIFTHVELLSQIVFGIIVATLFILNIWSLFHLALLIFLVSLNPILLPNVLTALPTVVFLIPFAVSILLILPFSEARRTLSWVRLGKIDPTAFVLICLTGIISTIALILWAFWTENLGVALEMMQGFSKYPIGVIWGVGVPLFALINAFAEESVYRGVMQEALQRVFRQQWIVLTLQASAFAAVHFAAGFPNGYMGYLMVFTYGLMLGYLRIRTDGMLAPYLAHIIADLTIGYLLFGLRSG